VGRGHPPIRIRLPPDLRRRLDDTLARLVRTSTAPLTAERRGELTLSDFIRRCVVNECNKIERSREWRRRKRELAAQRLAGAQPKADPAERRRAG